MRQETEAQNLHSFLDRVRLGRRLGLEPFSPTLGVQMRLTDPTVRGRDVLVTVPEHRLSFEMAYGSDKKKMQISEPGSPLSIPSSTF